MSRPGGDTLTVLHCIYDDPENPWVGGGGAVRVRELYRHLGDQVDATVLTGSYPGARDAEIDGVSYERRGAARPYVWSRWSYARAAERALRERSYDAAVLDFSVYTPVRLPRNRPIGVTVHHLTGPTARSRWGPLGGRAIAAAERSMLRRACWFSATSGATYEQLETLVRPGSEIARVGAGVSDELFRIERREREFLLYFGRMDWFQKGLDTLLEAVAVLIRERPALRLRLAGRGKDIDRVRRWVAENGLGRNVELIGEVTEAARRELFAGAQLLLMPSRFEGFGMVAAEAMAAGVPVVATAAGALPEVIDAPRGGVLVPPGDAPALAAATGRLLDQPSERVALSRSARISAERFRWGRVAEDHLDFLLRIAGATECSRSERAR